MYFLLLVALCLAELCQSSGINLIPAKTGGRFKSTEKRTEQQLPTLTIPYPVYPVANITLPSLEGKLVAVTGCRGIALEVVKLVHSLNASVSCTTRNLDTFDYSTLPSGVTVYELDWCREGSIKRFVKHYNRDNGRMWDALDDNALTVTNGDVVDWYDTDMDCAWRMNIKGSILLEQEFLRYYFDSNATHSVAWNYALSTAGVSQIPQFQPLYNLGKVFKFQHIKGRGLDQKFPFIRYSGIACVFANTNISRDALNPSADKGDYAQQKFQAITVAYTPVLGVPPSTVALAHVQMMFSNLYGGETIGQVLQLVGGSVNSATYYAQVMNTSLQYSNVMYPYMGSVFTIDTHNHTGYVF
jgi:hypothetical protein